MATRGSIALIVIGLLFTLGGGASSSFFQGRFDYNGCGNILGQIGSDLGALLGGGNTCINLQNARTKSQIGFYVGVLIMLCGIIALTVSLARRNRLQENVGDSR